MLRARNADAPIIVDNAQYIKSFALPTNGRIIAFFNYSFERVEISASRS